MRRHSEPQRPTVSVVIPCYNEEANIRQGVLRGVAEFARGSEYVEEVIVVDDGSVDRSAELIETAANDEPILRLLREPHRGKAGAVIAGVLAAKGDYILFCDLDQATPIQELTRLRPFMMGGFDVIVGSRAGRREGAPLVRQMMARGFILVRKIILNLGDITDTQCGFKAFSRVSIREAIAHMKVYREGQSQAKGATVTAAFDAELLYLTRRLGYAAREVPVAWHHVGTRRVHPIVESWRGLKGLLRIRLNAWLGRYPRRQPRVRSA